MSETILRDRIGQSIEIGDLVVYAGKVGRCAEMDFGVYGGLSQSKSSGKLFVYSNYHKKIISKSIRILGNLVKIKQLTYNDAILAGANYTKEMLKIVQFSEKLKKEIENGKKISNNTKS